MMAGKAGSQFLERRHAQGATAVSDCNNSYFASHSHAIIMSFIQYTVYYSCTDNADG